MESTTKETLGTWLTCGLGMVIGGVIGLIALGLVTAVYFLGESTGEMTFTQGLFVACLLFFGPVFGLIPASLIFRKGGVSGPVLACAGAAFIFAITASYIGWLLGGLRALGAFPGYPGKGPGELIASAFTLPGFLTGAGAVFLLMLYLQRPTYGKSFVTLLGAFVVVCVAFSCIAAG